MNQKKLLFIVSDLHLGDGKKGDDHVYQNNQFISFIQTRLVNIKEWGNGDIELFINGDFLEFAQVGQDLYKGDTDSGWCTEKESFDKLGLIIEGHKLIFEALKKFNINGNQLTIAAGNHDVDLYWSSVQKKIIETIGDTKFEIGEEIVSRFDGRLLIGHGHMYDPANKFKNWKEPIHNKDSECPRLEMCPGTKFMIKFVNLLEADYPFADNIIPESNLALILWKKNKIGFSVAAALLFNFMGTEPIATLGLPQKNEPKDVFKLIQNYLLIDKILEQITSLYNEVFNTNKTEIEVENILDDEKKLLEFLNAIFVKTTPDNQIGKWLEVMNNWPIKLTLSLNPKKNNTLSIVKRGLFDIKKDLLTKALSMLNDQVDIVVFGHTHQPDSGGYSNKKYFNPGSWTRYVKIEEMDGLELDDLDNEDTFPYQLNYVKIWRNSGEIFLKSEMITFDELFPVPK